MESIIEIAVQEIERNHLLSCRGGSKNCSLKHAQKIRQLREYDKIIERRVRSEIAGDFLEARDFWFTTAEAERGELAEWIKVIFDIGVKFIEGEK